MMRIKQKIIILFLTIVTMFFCISIPAHSAVILSDNFDDGTLDPLWIISYQSATDWVYNENGAELTVSEITPAVINPGGGGTWAIVSLSRDITPINDFSVDFKFSWDSEDPTTGVQDAAAAQILWIGLYDDTGTRIVLTGFHDAWSASSGEIYADTNTEHFRSGANSLPFVGSASINISRSGNDVVVSRDGTTIASGTAVNPLKTVEIFFYYYGTDITFFGTESVDWVRITDTSGPPPPAADCSVPVLLPDQMEVLFDDFDDSVLDPSWIRATEAVANPMDWYNEAGTDFIVADISPVIINDIDPRDGGTWAKTKLIGNLSSAIDDFDAYFCISWASEGLEAMQGFYVVLYDTDGNQIARSGYIDDVMYGHGLSFKQIGDGDKETIYAGSTGSDLIHISRRNGEVTIDWEQRSWPITGTNNNPVDRVELEFWHYGYDGPRGVSNFGTESVDLVQIVESAIPDPKAVLSIKKEAFDEEGNPTRVASVGDMVSYKITVANEGDLNASVTIFDALPSDMTFVSADDGSYNPLNGRWLIDPLSYEPPDNIKTLTIDASVLASADEKIILNRAEIVEGGPPTRTISDIASLAVGGQNLELSVTVHDSVNYYIGDLHIYYTLEVTNHGPETSPVIELWDLIPIINKLDGSPFPPSKIAIQARTLDLPCQGTFFDNSPYIRRNSCSLGTIDKGQTITRVLDIYYHDDHKPPDLKMYYDFRLQYSGQDEIIPVGLLNYATSAEGVTNVTGFATVGGSGGCFVATAAYGSCFEPHVMTLRQFRDSYLLTNKLGTKFVEAYYKFSPPMADFFAGHDSLRSVARIGLAPLVGFSWLAINYGMIVALAFLFSVLTLIAGGTYFLVKPREAS